MKEKRLQFIAFKRRPDTFRFSHNVGFQSFTHFIATRTGQKYKFGQNSGNTPSRGNF